MLLCTKYWKEKSKCHAGHRLEGDASSHKHGPILVEVRATTNLLSLCSAEHDPTIHIRHIAGEGS